MTTWYTDSIHFVSGSFDCVYFFFYNLYYDIMNNDGSINLYISYLQSLFYNFKQNSHKLRIICTIIEFYITLYNPTYDI